jgi:hypothetical protein
MPTQPNRFMNYTACTFTPATPTGNGTPVIIDGVTDVNDKSDAGIETFKGDNAVYDQAVASVNRKRSIDVTSADTRTVKSIPTGSRGSFIVTVLHHENGATPGGGAYTMALTNCIVSDNGTKHAHAKFADGTITFQGYSPDGVTDPLVVAPL